ncbi:hypothetical protein PV08_03348 [Exophiala spinifera]|uniref:Zn(2)-C6 fungal-type domain-containing protein n=1 Tax=Exophiala spinifera TaxID=91928 RepID=A0A0D2BJI6_9EURO|nr:uncharacterized protein PV08_03348 [Exophiala spinifera]KIW19058.1 hypothetical protein PV08_03348 [Exophiala spinifera]
MIPGRRKFSRTRTGCWTCRQAGYKCDEVKPACGRCTRLKIACEGYAPRLVWRDTATPESGGRSRKRKQTSEEAPTSGLRYHFATPSTTSTGPAPQSIKSEDAVDVVPRELLSPHSSPASMAQGLRVEEYRHLHHWTTVVAPLLSVTSKAEVNPFQRHFIPMAYDNGSLRYTMLLCAAKHLSLLVNQPQDQQLILRYQGLALRNLNEALSDENEALSNPTLAAVLLMQLSQMFASDQESRADHLVGAKYIIAKRHRLANNPDSCGRFLESLFKYHDVMSSITRSDRPLLNHDCPPASDSDAFLGSIEPLLEIISQISELQPRKKLISQNSVEDTDEATSDSFIRISGSLLETQLESWNSPRKDADWFNTAEAFRHAAFIYLYRVIDDIGAPDPRTLYHVKQCVEALRSTAITSPLLSIHAWPIFTAGCEALEASERDFCRQRLDDMFNDRKLLSLLRVKRAMEDVWDQKDREALFGADVGKLDCINVLKQKGSNIDLG